MRLYLVRHGQTHANVGRQLDTAHPGADLTDVGHDQARALADRLRGEDLGAIYVSDLVRTHQTAAPLAEELGLELVVLPGLREIQAGDYEMSTDWEPYVQAVVRWREDPSHTIPGGDSGIGFLHRFQEAIRTIAADGHASALAVSHGAAMRVWCGVVLDLPPDFFDTRRLDNTHIVTLEGDPDIGWTLLAWGDEPVTHD
ncbi:histidine phosphatase [Intrasporangium oryzae NRRL B-24470]|uniref:Histidine phosphatase n=1 Tax=Intrasporangium oryzae NRRL B-24470 TaxID=1386089 RepID=W9G5B2_9MICO|nr:histidine phosphatase family protein [Intrasporangium oryzae]EWT01215.1 histidine phosphatase [Intrasporangium oryzae NRRL B-24470]